MKDQSGRTLESMSQAVWYNRWTLKKFSKYLNGKILEVGCGIGNFTKFLLKYGKVTAIDVDSDYLKEAKSKVKDAEIGSGNIEKGKYPFKDKRFNTIVCINVLEHVKNDSTALRNIHQLLENNGILVLLVPAHKFLFNCIDQSIGHFRRYEKEKLIKQLKDCGFEIVETRRLNLIGGIGWLVTGKLFKEKEVSDTKIRIFNIISQVFLLLENIFEPPFGTSILVIARKSRT